MPGARRSLAAAGLALSLVTLTTVSVVAAPLASGTGVGWYAYAGGGATSPTTCPQTTTTADQCTLAQALSMAGAGDTVYLATPGGSGTGEADYVGNWSVSLTGTSASAPLTIEPASGVANPTLDGNGGSNSSPCSTSACDGPILALFNEAFVDIDGVTFQDGDDSAASYGGAIQNDGGGTLTVSGSTFSGNTAGWGGAIADGVHGIGTLYVSGSTFSDNGATSAGGAIVIGILGFGTVTVSGSTFSGNGSDFGGAINNGIQGTGTLAVTSSTFSGNSAGLDGGAIDNGDDGGSGALTVSGVTFSTNTAGWGGAIDNGDNGGTGDLNVSDSTFTTNSVSIDGGAIDNADDGPDNGASTVSVTGSTFSDNATGRDGGTIDNGDFDGTGTVWAAADIFSSGSSGSCDQVSGAWHDEGFNVASDGSCLSNPPTSNDVDAGAGLSTLLGPLADNGGPTQTLLPLPGNPAIGIIPDPASVDLGSTSATLCPTTDQRGVASEPGQACAAGSVQEGPPVALAQSFSTTEGTELTEPAGTLLTGVSDGNPGASSWTAELTATASDGTVVVHADGSFTYTPVAGFVGNDSFSYTLTDNLGYTSSPATVTLAVRAGPVSTTTTTTPTTTSTTTALTGTPTTTTTTSTITAGPAPNAGTTIAQPPPQPFPNAALSYPNGALVSFGASHYVFAGGRAFAASASEMRAVEKVDHAKVLPAPVSAVAPTAVAPRSGTLVTTRAADGDSTIYVAGTDGELHGFSTGYQFLSDGYDPALVVTVPSLGVLKVGATAGAEGSAADALATRADGAIVDASGTLYVFAGGKAFGISSPVRLGRVEKADKAKVLTGAVAAAETRSAIASGVLLSAPGKVYANVYASYTGALYLFKTTAQLAADGYSGTAAVPVPGTGGLAVVSPYSGS